MKKLAIYIPSIEFGGVEKNFAPSCSQNMRDVTYTDTDDDDEDA